MLEFSWLGFAFAVVNFVVLMGLLWKFLHKPLLAILEKRQAAIVAAHEQAASETEKATATKAEYEQKLAATATEREAVLADARKTAEETRLKLIDEATAEAKRSIDELKKADERERRDAEGALQQSIVDAVLAVAGSVLEKVADTDLNTKLHDRLLIQLDELVASTEKVSAGEGCTVGVTSAAELSAPQRAAVVQRLQAIGANESAVTFAVDTDLIAGTRVEFSDRAIDASLVDILERIREAVGTSDAPASEEGAAS